MRRANRLGNRSGVELERQSALTQTLPKRASVTLVALSWLSNLIGSFHRTFDFVRDDFFFPPVGTS